MDHSINPKIALASSFIYSHNVKAMNKLIILSSSLVTFGLLSSCSTISKLRQNSANKNDQILAPAQKLSEAQKLKNAERLRAMEPVSKVKPVTSDTSNNKPVKKNRTIQGMIEPNVTGLPETRELQESTNVLPLESPSITPPSNTTSKLPNSISPIIPEIPKTIKPETIKPLDTTPLTPTIPTLPSLPGALDPLPTPNTPQ